MLDKLQELEQVLAGLTSQYHIVATELANLKNRPNNDAKNEAAIVDLHTQLDNAQQQLNELQTQLNAQSKELSDKNEYIALLHQTNDQLTQENSELKQKNRLAFERAEVIQHWLVNIDNATNHNKELQ